MCATDHIARAPLSWVVYVTSDLQIDRNLVWAVKPFNLDSASRAASGPRKMHLRPLPAAVSELPNLAAQKPNRT